MVALATKAAVAVGVTLGELLGVAVAVALGVVLGVDVSVAVLVFDGATGTSLQQMNLSADDFGGAALEGLIIVQTRFVSGLAFSAIRNGRAVPLPIEITVSDNGAGVDAALRDHVFVPFVSSKPSGQGLGLPLVRKLVRDMNGRITHERDETGGWTHFRLHLPLASGK